MSRDFILPDIGEGIVECELVDWLVSEGDIITEDQPVAEVMTDKALVQIPSPYAGRISKLYYDKGDIARVHQPLFAIEEESATAEPAAEKESKPAAVEPTTASPGEQTQQEFILPDIGEGIVECELVDWLVSEGEVITEDQPVAEVMTDKALVQIPSPYAGRITRLHYRKGDIAKVHQPLFTIATGQTAHSTKPVTPPPSDTPHARAPAPPSAATLARGRQRIPASPAVRRLAREAGIELAQVRPSGKNGRVLKEDIQAHLQRAATPQTESQIPQRAPQAGRNRLRTHSEPVRGFKAAMARQMTAANAVPHFTYGDEVRMDALLALKRQLAPRAEAQGVRLTLMPFFMKAMALALEQFPLINSHVDEACSEIHYQGSCNIGMAVDSKVGLLVPNVKHCESRSILEIASEVQRLTEAARSGRIEKSDLQGGSITISNIGAIGGTYMVPVINTPEVAIVALGQTRKLPRFNDQGEVEAQQLMQISWSGDHRVIEGATMARFSNAWKALLENPVEMLLEMT